MTYTLYTVDDLARDLSEVCIVVGVRVWSKITVRHDEDPPPPPSPYARKVSIDQIIAAGADIDLIELRTLKPLDMETIAMSLRRTHKVG